MREFTQYITPDGLTYNFDALDKFLISETGYGMPAIEYQTQQGPFQHGNTALDYRLQPRVIQIIHRVNACSRTEYYNNRSTFLNFIRPNRQTPGNFTPGVLRKVLPDGKRRDLKVFLEQGPEFVARSSDRWDEWSFHETIRFIANDPILYDPTEQVVSLTSAATVDLWEFPLELPRPMGRNFVVGDPLTAGSHTHITYAGTWLAYPRIVLVGPMDGPTIQNYSTGESISFLYNVNSGETITLDLSYGNKSVVSSIAGNILWAVRDTSDLAMFHLAPAPEVTIGDNILTFDAGSWLTGTSSATIRYYTRYIGL